MLQLEPLQTSVLEVVRHRRASVVEQHTNHRLVLATQRRSTSPAEPDGTLFLELIELGICPEYRRGVDHRKVLEPEPHEAVCTPEVALMQYVHGKHEVARKRARQLERAAIDPRATSRTEGLRNGYDVARRHNKHQCIALHRCEDCRHAGG